MEGLDMNNKEKPEFKNNKSLTPIARVLRKNMTKEEKHLWYDFLSKYPIRIYRQRTIGKYIADFYCAKAKLVIELDGSQHGKAEIEMKDIERTSYLSNFGLTVVRIPNYVINNHFNEVCRYIDSLIVANLKK